MAFLTHLRACNRYDLTGFRPFVVDGQRVGWVRHALAEQLPGIDSGFVVGPDRVTIADDVRGFDARTALLGRAAAALVARGAVPALRDEHYPAMPSWGAPPLFSVDRAVVPLFGIAAYGLHVNGYVRDADGGLSLWVGRRARDRMVAPGKLDNLIAGGQPIGLTLRDNLVKEAWEEAGLDRELALRAKPVGAITYTLETPAGLKPDTLFLYDLELPAGVVPRNTDGEVEEFMLWPIDRVAASVRDTDDWKFNCTLVVIDFLIRHGWLGPEEDGYLDLVTGLRR